MVPCLLKSTSHIEDYPEAKLITSFLFTVSQILTTASKPDDASNLLSGLNETVIKLLEWPWNV